MTRARFVVTLPPDSPLGGLSREMPEATFRILAALGGNGGGFGVGWITAPDISAVLNEMASLRESIVLSRTEREAAVQFETAESALLDAALAAGLPIEMPIDVEDGRAAFDVVGDSERITALARELESSFRAVEIDYVREQVDSGRYLTQKQRRLVASAVGMGYYDTPRRCSLTDLAAELDLAKSTTSETLHRAEEVIVKAYVRATESSESHQSRELKK